jgi:tetratricopeptide (TPR) repeat protein
LDEDSVDINSQIAGLNSRLSKLYQQSRYEEAIDVSQELLTIVCGHYRENHTSCIDCINNLAVLYSLEADYDKAEEYHKKAINIWGRTVGKDNPKYAGMLNSIATVYSYKSDYDKAEQYFNYAIDIWGRTVGKDNSDYAISLRKLATVYFNKHDYDKAEQYYKRSLDRWTEGT